MAPKGSSAVVIETGKPEADAFREAASALSARGYQIESSDINTGVISTAFLNLPGDAPEIRVNASVSGGLVTLTGVQKPIGARSEFSVTLQGLTGSPNWKAWKELEEIASLIGEAISFK